MIEFTIKSHTIEEKHPVLPGLSKKEGDRLILLALGMSEDEAELTAKKLNKKKK